MNKTNYYLQKIKEVYGEIKTAESQYNNTYNLMNSNQNNYNSQHMIDNRITDDKKLFNINNYNNYNNYDIDNDNNYRPNSSTKHEIVKGQKSGGGAYETAGEPPTVLRIDSSLNNSEMPISFRGKKIVKFFGFCMILLGLIGSLKRPDFPNIVEGILAILCCIIGIKNGKNQALKWFKNLLLADFSPHLHQFFVNSESPGQV